MNQRVLILTAGSRGDVQPYVALAKGLQQASFEVTLATDPYFQDFVIRHGVSFAPLRAPFAQMAQTEVGKAAILGKKSISLKQIMPIMRQMMDDAWAIAQQVHPDAVIYHPKTLAGYHIADKLGIPGLLAMAIPAYSPTSAFLNPVFGGGDFLPECLRHHSSLLNKLSYTLFFKASLLPYRGFINNWRKEKLDLPPFKDELTLREQAVPKLYAYSPSVVPIPPDWDETSFVTGYWFLEEDAAWEPPLELVEFLDRGTPPVYIGFGSMSSEDSGQIPLVLDAIRQSDVRAILATGWGGLSALDLPETVYMLESAPHGWLFPRCSAVVHHGGAGTTGAGLKAGQPTIICPFFGDQPFWGKQVHQLGVGPRPIPQKHLSAEGLALSIQEAISDDRMRQRARSLGEKIRSEDGVAQAIRLVEAQW